MNKSNIENLNDEWLTMDEACKLLRIKPKTLKDRCRKGEIEHRIFRNNREFVYYINKNSIPRIQKEKLIPTKEYANAPEWARNQADKYIRIINNTRFLRGKELKKFIEWWNKKHPNLKTSYTAVNRMKVRYECFGINGLLAQYGKNLHRSVVKNKYFDYFKKLYLIEGAPSLHTCWENTLGYAMRTSNLQKDDFPSPNSFLRRLKKEMPTQAIYLARYGESSFNMKFGSYIERDYSNIKCGKVWVSDHAQIDVAVFDPEGNVVFPWVTAWRDYKSGKWLGWMLECGSPNSDRIFQAFYYAAKEYGLPDDVIIDNGKDYRSKDFAGGRPKIDDSQKGRTTSMLDLMGVQVHFALPYNAQTKPIERDFRTIKEYLSKHCQGYRGGNVVERPEYLVGEIKSNKIMPFDKFKNLFNEFIVEVFNKRDSQGKNLNGLSPDELFNAEFTEKRVATAEGLKLFCMRTSNNYTIYRNGIKDRKLGITYWADWMVAQMKVKVYLRRDPENFKEAWVFRADNNEFLGACFAVNAVAALHAGDISKEEFKEAMEIKKRSLKITKAYLDDIEKIPFEEQCENYKTVFAKKIKKANPKITKIANTSMDQAVQKRKEMDAYGKNDMSMFLNEDAPKKKFYYYETEKYLDEDDDLMEVAYGY
ncbi:DDE-type integrase/transposase/recombinase [bacterium]|nr:DDE-type integrase/transposase/recombinase [bacterium]